MLGGGATAKRLEGLGPVRPEGTAGTAEGRLADWAGLGHTASGRAPAGVRGYAGGSGKSLEGSKLQSTVT